MTGHMVFFTLFLLLILYFVKNTTTNTYWLRWRKQRQNFLWWFTSLAYHKWRSIFLNHVNWLTNISTIKISVLFRFSFAENKTQIWKNTQDAVFSFFQVTSLVIQQTIIILFRKETESKLLIFWNKRQC